MSQWAVSHRAWAHCGQCGAPYLGLKLTVPLLQGGVLDVCTLGVSQAGCAPSRVCPASAEPRAFFPGPDPVFALLLGNISSGTIAAPRIPAPHLALSGAGTLAALQCHAWLTRKLGG